MCAADSLCLLSVCKTVLASSRWTYQIYIQLPSLKCDFFLDYFKLLWGTCFSSACFPVRILTLIGYNLNTFKLLRPKRELKRYFWYKRRTASLTSSRILKLTSVNSFKSHCLFTIATFIAFHLSPIRWRPVITSRDPSPNSLERSLF